MADKKTVSKKVLSVADFIASRAVKLIEAEVEDLGGVVYLRPLTAGDMVDYMHTQRKEATDAERRNGTVVMLTRSVCNPDGSRLFEGISGDELSNLPAPIFTKLLALTNKLNGVEESTSEKGKG
jgi:hypothetical protein